LLDLNISVRHSTRLRANNFFKIDIMKQTFFSIVTIFILSGCHRNIAEFSITNNKSVSIDFLSIEPNAFKKKVIKVQPKETVLYKMDLANFENMDGGYVITYQTGKHRINKGFGYFTNGSQCESKAHIIIKENDSLEFDFKY
jgi:hypothetical protein